MCTMLKFALLCSVVIYSVESSPFINKLKEMQSNMGNAVRNMGASIFNKISGGKAEMPPPPPQLADVDILKQLEFVNNMLKQVKGFMMNPSPLIREKMQPYTQTLIDQIIPQLEKLQFNDHELQTIYKLSRPEDIIKFRSLLAESLTILKEMSSYVKVKELKVSQN